MEEPKDTDAAPVDAVVLLREELKRLQVDMEAAWGDYSRLNYDWLARCISAINRTESLLGSTVEFLEREQNRWDGISADRYWQTTRILNELKKPRQ